MFEHILVSNIMKYLNTTKALSPAQHGFRQGFSYSTQLVEFFHDMSEATDNKKQIDCLFLDFRKAFDSVCHDRLLSKLESYGIEHSIILWVQEYLTDKKQRVILNGAKS